MAKKCKYLGRLFKFQCYFQPILRGSYLSLDMYLDNFKKIALSRFSFSTSEYYFVLFTQQNVLSKKIFLFFKLQIFLSIIAIFLQSSQKMNARIQVKCIKKCFIILIFWYFTVVYTPYWDYAIVQGKKVINRYLVGTVCENWNFTLDQKYFVKTTLISIQI